MAAFGPLTGFLPYPGDGVRLANEGNALAIQGIHTLKESTGAFSSVLPLRGDGVSP